MGYELLVCITSEHYYTMMFQIRNHDIANVPPADVLSPSHLVHHQALPIMPTTAKANFVDDVKLVLGPVVVGTVFNAFVYGICLIQFTHYWEHKSNDSIILRSV